MAISTGKAHLFWETALAAALAVVGAQAAAQRSCPDFVERPTGSSLNVARLINDTGSPDAALQRLRRLLVQATESGCPAYEKRAACDETLAVARQAITALELCTGQASVGNVVR